MGDEFSVHHAELTDGAGELSGPAGRAIELAGQVKQALTGLAEAAGHPGLATALMETTLLNARRLAELDVLYRHVQESLGSVAKGYAATDTKAADRIRASGSRAS
jgi:hypothetical protein